MPSIKADNKLAEVVISLDENDEPFSAYFYNKGTRVFDVEIGDNDPTNKQKYKLKAKEGLTQLPKPKAKKGQFYLTLTG